MKKNESIDFVRIVMKKDRTLLSNSQIHSPEDVLIALEEELREWDRECVAIINLQTDGRPININIVSIGSINETLFSPSNIFKSAILSNASSIMMVHNHPSGNVTPSQADIIATKRILECSNIMGIKLLDHIIIGSKLYSMREHNVLDFNMPSNHSVAYQCDLHDTTIRKVKSH